MFAGKTCFLTVMLLGASFAIAGANDPVINNVVVDPIANTIVITGSNLFGADNASTPRVTLAQMQLAILSSSSVSITAKLPAGLSPGVYILTLSFTWVSIPSYPITYNVSIGGSTSSSNVVMSVDSISCRTPAGSNTFPVGSWSIGASATASGPGPGGGAGAFQYANLAINKTFDDCSPDLFGNVVQGRHFRRAILTQYAADHTTLLTITLGDGDIVSYNLSGGNTSSNPQESLDFSYSMIDIKDAVTGSHFCWNLKTQTACSGL